MTERRIPPFPWWNAMLALGSIGWLASAVLTLNPVVCFMAGAFVSYAITHTKD